MSEFIRKEPIAVYELNQFIYDALFDMVNPQFNYSSLDNLFLGHRLIIVNRNNELFRTSNNCFVVEIFDIKLISEVKRMKHYKLICNFVKIDSVILQNQNKLKLCQWSIT